LISEMIHIKEQKNGINSQTYTELLNNSFGIQLSFGIQTLKSSFRISIFIVLHCTSNHFYIDVTSCYIHILYLYRRTLRTHIISWSYYRTFIDIIFTNMSCHLSFVNLTLLRTEDLEIIVIILFKFLITIKITILHSD